MSSAEEPGFSRRQAVAAGLVGAASLTAPTEAAGKGSGTRTARSRMPVVYLPHGGGPWPFADLGLPKTEVEALLAYLRALPAVPKEKPKALLVVSAHWEERVPTVMTSAEPPMLYDYYGFPPSTYEVTWPARGAPALAARVRDLLRAGGFESAENPTRGFDHGTFVPLKVAYPAADVPTVQLSLKVGLDPAEHLALGRALAPLRDEEVFIVGSGMSFHNMRGFFGDPRAPAMSETFDAWLAKTVTAEPTVRDQGLVGWAGAPAARYCHPREEHLLPLMVVAGAAGSDRGTTAFAGKVFGTAVSAYHFG